MPRIPDPVRFARMAGSSIAAPSAAGWVTDFLNAAYYARPVGERDVADLRLAHGIVTTRWALSPRGRLDARDVVALHRAFGRLRLRGRGRLDREALLAGACALLGDWFPAAWADSERRAHGIAFPTAEERRAFAPERRLAHAALGVPTPPRLDPAEQHWATYDPVPLPDSEAALALLLEPARWPDIGSDTGRFTALRSGVLLGQTFEIEVVAGPTVRTPVFTRGYVSCTALHTGDEAGLGPAVATLEARYRAAGGGTVLPDRAEPLALVVLATHDGHFLGRGLSHLLVWRDADGSWIRDVGAWDPLPAHLAVAYVTVGRAAQQDFWGPARPARSMLAQLALVSAAG